MRHLLMDPAFPDVVGEYAYSQLELLDGGARLCANDNGDAAPDELSDPLLDALCRADIAANRLW